MEKESNPHTVDTIISERFAVLEAAPFNPRFYARRFDDLCEYLDYYTFDEEQEEEIVKSEFIPVDFGDYLAFTRNLLHIIDFSFETMHVLLQHNGTDNTAICFVGEELGIQMSILCFHKLHGLFIKERDRHVSKSKAKNKSVKGREYIELCVEEFQSYIYLDPLPDEWKEKLKKYIKMNFEHYDDYIKAGGVLARFTLKVNEVLKTVKDEELTEEFLKSLQPPNHDDCMKKVERNQEGYMVIKLQSKWNHGLFDII